MSKVTVDRSLLRDTMICMGDCKYFRCDCGCNVFKKIGKKPPKFSCNACDATYTGEK